MWCLRQKIATNKNNRKYPEPLWHPIKGEVFGFTKQVESTCGRKISTDDEKYIIKKLKPKEIAEIKAALLFCKHCIDVKDNSRSRSRWATIGYNDA